MSVFPEMHSRPVIHFFEIDRNFLVNLTVFKFSDDNVKLVRLGSLIHAEH